MKSILDLVTVPINVKYVRLCLISSHCEKNTALMFMVEFKSLCAATVVPVSQHLKELFDANYKTGNISRKPEISTTSQIFVLNYEKPPYATKSSIAAALVHQKFGDLKRSENQLTNQNFLKLLTVAE